MENVTNAEKAFAERKGKIDSERTEQKNNALKDLIQSINDKFNVIGNQLTGFVGWTTKAVRKIELEQRQQAVQMSVQDIGLSALLQELKEKSIISEESYKEKVQAIFVANTKK